MTDNSPLLQVIGARQELTVVLPVQLKRVPAWAEGPAALDLGDRVLLVYDVYRDGHYGALVSRDFSAWEKPAAGCALPPGARHGSLLAVPPEAFAPELSARLRDS